MKIAYVTAATLGTSLFFSITLGGASAAMRIPGGTIEFNEMPAPQPHPATQMRVEGAAILKHPIGNLALDYVALVHAGKMEEAMKLATTSAQAKWKAEPASERAESAAFRKQVLPTRDELVRALSGAGGGGAPGSVLIFQRNTRATLNVIRVEQKSNTPGVVNSSATTTTIPFEKENGQWKLAQ